MKLYFAPGACSLAPRIVASEMGIPIETVKVDLADHKTADGRDFYTINPRGYVPALELSDGAVMTETSILVQYLADLAPTKALIPPFGTRERYYTQEWLNFLATELHKGFGPLWNASAPEETKASARARLVKVFKELDQRLGKNAYIAGSSFSVVDAYAYTLLNWAAQHKLDLLPYGHLLAWQAKVFERPKVKSALIAEGLLKAAA